MLQSLHRGVFLATLPWLWSLPPLGIASDWVPVEGLAPKLLGQTLDDQPWHLNDYRGCVVLVHFWAGWCSACLEEMPGLNRLSERMQGKPFVLVGINTGESAQRIRALINQFGIRFGVVTDPDQIIFKDWSATILPTSYVLDAKGRLSLIGQGPLDWEDPVIREAIDKLVDEVPPSLVSPIRRVGLCGRG